MSTTPFNVKGMRCPSCIRHIHQALVDIDGVEHIDVRLREGQVLVQHAAGVDPSALRAAIEDAGYEAERAA